MWLITLEPESYSELPLPLLLYLRPFVHLKCCPLFMLFHAAPHHSAVSISRHISLRQGHLTIQGAFSLLQLTSTAKGSSLAFHSS